MKTNHRSDLTKFFFRTAYTKRLKHFFGDIKNLKIIDIGAGYGHLSYAAKNRGAIVDILEPRVECYEALISLNCNQLYRCSLSKGVLQKENYDIAVMISVIDEVEDKIGFLQEVLNSVKNKGFLLIEVRNTQYFPFFKKNINTDISCVEYVKLFDSLGLKLIRTLGVSRPLTFGSVEIFLKTLFSNFISIFISPNSKQMLIFCLVKDDSI